MPENRAAARRMRRTGLERTSRTPPAEGVGEHPGRHLEDEYGHLQRRPQQHQPQRVQVLHSIKNSAKDPLIKR
jgi:hypothetical protein